MKPLRRLAFASIILTLALIGTPLVSGNDFTLEQVLGSPFPSDLIASKSGDKVAWVFDAQGRRNIWIAEAPAFKGRQLTRYDKDDGQTITEPVFSPDGSWIAFVRGGPPNAEREIPNPTSDPAGARQEICLANVRTGAVSKLGEGARPFFSPAGDRVIFSREDHLWWAPVSTLAARAMPAKSTDAAKKLFEIRGTVSSPSWSPDGSRLVFVSGRGDHSFLAIYDPKPGSVRFLEPSIDRDIEPRWSPDGKRIAYIRLVNISEAPPSADRERLAQWSIRVVDAVSGRGKEVWRSGNTAMDSFSRLPVGDNMLQWAAGDRVVFASEKDGWAHLYSVSANEGGEKALTPGSYEVESVTWSPDRSYAIVASNNGDIDHRHLWKVNVAGGAPEQLTSGRSVEMYPVILSAGRQVAFFHSTGTQPFLPYIASSDLTGRKPLAEQALPREFPAGHLAEPEQVIFKAADGLEIHGQLFKPKGAAGRAPAVIFMHGGPVRQMLLGWHYRHYYHNAYAFNQYLASRGYIVLSVNYRSGVGYGRAFREAKNRGQRGASEYQDIVAAGKYLRSRSDVDGKRIGLWGGSYGGYLTAMGLARDSDLFAAGVDIHGVHDWSARIGRGPGGGASAEMTRLARESSPISSVDKWKSPVLLIHGDDDRNVAFSQTVDLVRKLREHRVEFEQLIFPDEVHDFLRHENWLRAYRASSDFFDKHLKAPGETFSR